MLKINKSVNVSTTYDLIVRLQQTTTRCWQFPVSIRNLIVAWPVVSTMSTLELHLYEGLHVTKMILHSWLSGLQQEL